MLNKSSSHNIPNSVESKIGCNLHLKDNHPISIIKNHIYNYLSKIDNFEIYDHLSPIVSIEDNFDHLLIPKNHPSRSKSDTYYINDKQVLRSHTSAHQNELLSKGQSCFLVTGDVYRKDEIDRYHYNIFHQMEGLKLVDNDIDPIEDLKKVLTGLVEYLFPNCEYQFLSDYFPFTDPSLQIEVQYNGKALEILGSGQIHHDILSRHQITKKGWAFGLGLERLAMVLFEIPDIRLLWSTHHKFLDQFQSGVITKFKPFSSLDSVHKDVSFWINNVEQDSWLDYNSFCEIVRDTFEDQVEEIKLIDKFVHPKTKKMSHTYRLKISSTSDCHNSSELTEYSNKYMLILTRILSEKLDVTIR